ncbi:hypothetical protein FNV43_RR21597 [Rhamnella rubrinervis]|uniref:Uncharacterized protein n=1 Tax=Rhamnella rubrinervis TaxID=2594499 RepID=A0A8K0E0B3_9ROSA|nr:hypothetical protein FNV43_RR21597 [Rhamnella rubrinervis]
MSAIQVGGSRLGEQKNGAPLDVDPSQLSTHTNKYSFTVFQPPTASEGRGQGKGGLNPSRSINVQPQGKTNEHPQGRGQRRGGLNPSRSISVQRQKKIDENLQVTGFIEKSERANDG